MFESAWFLLYMLVKISVENPVIGIMMIIGFIVSAHKLSKDVERWPFPDRQEQEQ